MKPHCVLDASALLAWLFQEPGASVVTQALGKGAVISSINWSETLQKLLHRGITPDKVSEDLTQRQVLDKALNIVPFSRQDAGEVASLVNETSKYGLSLADRACLVLACRLNIPALTADKVWGNLHLPELDIKLIR
ncbi:MAG: type II toxin-antitoxin system VapC family toxin [Cyanobacteria bacterium P01_A01_bin.68]